MNVVEEPKANKINGTRFQIDEYWYFIKDTLPVDRYIRYVQMVPEITYGFTFEYLNKTFNDIHAAATSGNDLIAGLRTCAELSYNASASLITFAERPIPRILLFCTLFIVREDEEFATWDEAFAELKIQDWIKSGIDMADFFLLAANFIPHFKEKYKLLAEEEEEKSRQMKEMFQRSGTATTSKRSEKG